jgi:uncharacterized small protein (DUF1192 family)
MQQASQNPLRRVLSFLGSVMFGLRAWFLRPALKRMDRHFSVLHDHVTYKTRGLMMNSIEQQNRLATLQDKVAKLKALRAQKAASEAPSADFASAYAKLESDLDELIAAEEHDDDTQIDQPADFESTTPVTTDPVVDPSPGYAPVDTTDTTAVA